MNTRILLAFLSAALAVVGALATDIEGKRIIKQPASAQDNSTHSILRSIELTDTATIVDYSFLHSPNYWCSIDSMELVGNVTGKKYPIKGTVGYTLRKRQYMPASCRYDFSIIFPAIDHQDTSVDMLDLEEDGSWTVLRKGIDLTGDGLKAKYVTHINGTYEGEGTFVGIFKSGSHLNRNQKVTWVPVDNGKFSYDLRSDDLLVYDIVNGPNMFMGAWSSGRFFSENATIDIAFTPEKDEDYGMSEIEYHDISVNAPGGSLTSSLQEHHKRMKEEYDNAAPVIEYKSLMDNKKFYTPEYYALEEAYIAHPEQKDSLAKAVNDLFDRGVAKTPEGLLAEKEIKRYNTTERLQSQCRDAVSMDNLAGLFAIVSECFYADDTTPMVEAYLNSYRGKFPDSEYAAYMEAISNVNEIAPGNSFNDFTAPDAEGNVHRFSELIDGKPALLDLWAVWCGPCRRTSMSMIPVYDEYASRGFTIIGVARVAKGDELPTDAIEKDGYKWINLFDVDDANRIWALYRCQNAAGGTFLISPEGKIVKSGVTAEDVRAYLKTLYGD